MNPADRLRLEHMLGSARAAMSFASGRSREDLARDRMLLRSIERELEIVGEAANKVSKECRLAHPEIPWEDMIGMRHRLIHSGASRRKSGNGPHGPSGGGFRRGSGIGFG